MPTKPKAKGPQVRKLAPTQVSIDWTPQGDPIWTNTPPPPELEKQFSWRAIWCAGFDIGEDGKKHYHHLECIPCHCPPGPQMRMQYTRAREIALLGGRGSAKSEGTFAFLTNGNPVLDLHTLQGLAPANPSPIDITYLNAPDYSFLVLRKNSKDLKSYFTRASRYFEYWGGTPTQEPMGVKFPSGAYGIFDHLADADSYEKYIGAEFTRIVMEEANQIPEELRYLKIAASCRTSNLQMLPQIVLTYNPGGPGAQWLKSRFIMPNGRKQPFEVPYTDEFSGQQRIAIFSKVEDNPYTMASGYDKVLDSLRGEDQALYKQWRFGDFDVAQGQYFQMFRLHPLTGEPENACHVVKPHKLPAEWPAAICGDFGYSHPSAIYGLKWSPKKQLHVHREFVVSRMGVRELGSEIARRWLDDLAEMPVPKLNLYLSHDAFHRENEGLTEAEMIRDGIEAILGKDSAFVFDRTEEELLLDRDASWEAVKARRDARRSKTHITVINAGMKRRANLNLIRDYMRWTPLATDCMEFNQDVYVNLLRVEGEHSAQEYVKKCQPKAPETLPTLQIHYWEDAIDPRDRGCQKLVTSIQSMVEKENDTEVMAKLDGDDPVDALAYGVGNFKFQFGYVSDSDQLKAKIMAIRAKNPNIDTNSLIRQAERIEAEQKRSKKTKGFSFGRVVGPMRHRLRAGVR